MTDLAPPEEQLEPVCGAAIVYLGPVAPHWEIRHVFGEQRMIDDFRTRVNARLLLLPRHDPQFRRNKERVNRDAERELIRVDWDLGDDDADSGSRPGGLQRPATGTGQPAPAAEPVAVAPAPEAEPDAPDTEAQADDVAQAEEVASSAEVASGAKEE